MADTPPSAAERLEWWRFCEMLEVVLEIQHSSVSATKKDELLKGVVYSHWTDGAKKRGESLYPYVRLMLPTKDPNRAKYQLKEAKIGQ